MPSWGVAPDARSVVLVERARLPCGKWVRCRAQLFDFAHVHFGEWALTTKNN